MKGLNITFSNWGGGLHVFSTSYPPVRPLGCIVKQLGKSIANIEIMMHYTAGFPLNTPLTPMVENASYITALSEKNYETLCFYKAT